MSETTASSAAIGPLDITRVMAALPHRYPMLLVDRVEKLVPDEWITAIKAVSFNERSSRAISRAGRSCPAC